ncbi:MAG: 2,3,4,5-tetrahydropyridine-2,6-dicarboxylate N-succinyltransferase [Candidatus Marinimicrobia bacterium]|nr:2,3,4,5-tetrahydropyridine-2,6-dicarboxylate N-succinyltransferase [Candidatus Neomarinimicrobiota bacterium]MCF7830040.1 2,3,4,5-tetrahydropyridine-2,6-dicarboxylate N-succinyltransferase [Candidatus Neomarinimicrobiota bacterium]MCF7881920.1 2,3,4,5-tetrahydropyridine-2,6-dicarboxylate N-succinyltransferase [Candidatus Neomarinimicrobiota bacterium]
MTTDQIKERIQELYDENPDNYTEQDETLFTEFKSLLNEGTVRSAEPQSDGWKAVSWVKEGILIGFRMGKLVDYSVNEQFRYFDKHTYPLKQLTLENQVRQVPGGSSIRDGSYISPEVVIMPPVYINVGAYVDAESMVDSHALVGSCAQIGSRVHLSAGVQIGGVLEPIGALPVIVEDGVMVGGSSGIYEGTIVKQNAVIGAGVTLTAGTPIYDLVNEEVIRAKPGEPLVVPEDAVVVPGSRKIEKDFAEENGLSIYTPLIVKYRDEKTDSATVLEDSLR